MAGFGLPNFGQLTEAFKKAQEIQQNAQALQDELDGMEIEGQSADGRASVWLSGNQQPLRVRLDPELLSAIEASPEPNLKLLAMNVAMSTASELAHVADGSLAAASRLTRERSKVLLTALLPRMKGLLISILHAMSI